MSRVLVVEDEAHLAEGLRFNLEAEGYSAEVVGDGEAATERLLAKKEDFDAVVLDIMLPGKDGFSVVSELRAARNYVPVLMLTARGRPEDVLQGFASGADDYLPKPFDFPVLVARIGALIRRAQPAIPPVLRHEDLVLDAAKRRAFRGERPLELAPKEFGVLELLLASQGRTVSTEELLERVWDENADPFTGAVKITMSRLRAKLGDPPIIHTVAKSGYRV